jgi:hypothetical protein
MRIWFVVAAVVVTVTHRSQASAAGVSANNTQSLG